MSITSGAASPAISALPTVEELPAIDRLPARTLEKQELRGLVDRLAEKTELWRDSVEFSSDQRHYVSLYRDEYVDVWLLCWTTAATTPAGTTTTCPPERCASSQGALVEHNLRVGGAQHRQRRGRRHGRSASARTTSTG